MKYNSILSIIILALANLEDMLILNDLYGS